MFFLRHLSFLIILSPLIYSQTNQWVNFFAPSHINCQILDGEDILVGTNDYLAKVTTSTGKTEMIHFGEPIASIAIDKDGNKWLGTDDNRIIKYDGKNWTVNSNPNSSFHSYSMNSFAIDLEGNKWIGTRDSGLIKFDGINWTIYNKNNSQLKDNRVRAITVDKFGNKWIGTQAGGLAKFDGKDWVIYDTSNSCLPDNCVRAITVDQQGCIWVGASDIYGLHGGLVKYDGQNWTKYNNSSPSIKCNLIYSIAIDQQGNKWIGSNGGIAKFDGKNWTNYNTSNSSLPRDAVSSIVIDQKGNKWITTREAENGPAIVSTHYFKITKFDGQSWTIYEVANSGLPENYILAFAIDQQGNKWVGTNSGPFSSGIVKYDDRIWTNFNARNYYFSSFISCMTIDKQGDKWIGTIEGGVVKFDLQKSTTYNLKLLGLPDNHIRAIAVDEQDCKWIGTDSGLIKYDGINWSIYHKTNSGLTTNLISSIAIDLEGNKWIGTYGGELFKYDGRIWTLYDSILIDYPYSYLRGFPIRTIAIDSSGNKWLAVSGRGLMVFNGKSWKVYNTSNSGIPSNYPGTIAIDKQGNKWIGGQNNDGLTKFDGSRWTVFNTSNSELPTNNIRVISIDQQGNKWLGTYGAGLSLFREEGIILTAMEKNSINCTELFSLHQNYPNPFNPITKISFLIPYDISVKLKVYNILGKEVRILIDEFKKAGTYEVHFDASSLPSGIYIYSMQAGQYRDSKKMLLLK